MEETSNGDYELYYPNKHDSLGLFVCNCGWQDCNPNYEYGPVEWEYYLIHFVKKGKGTYIVGDRKYQIGQNQGFIIKPHEKVKYQADKDNPWEYYWVGFNGSDIKYVLEDTGLDKNYVFNIENSDEIINRMKNINEWASREVFSSYRIIGELYILFSWIVKTESGKKIINIHKDIVTSCVDKINKNYSRNIVIADLAKEYNVDRATLFRSFKNIMALSPKQYLINLRLEKARDLLVDTTLNVKEISYSVGFSDLPHFCRLFKIKYGISPITYRKGPFETKKYN